MNYRTDGTSFGNQRVYASNIKCKQSSRIIYDNFDRKTVSRANKQHNGKQEFKFSLAKIFGNATRDCHRIAGLKLAWDSRTSSNYQDVVKLSIKLHRTDTSWIMFRILSEILLRILRASVKSISRLPKNPKLDYQRRESYPSNLLQRDSAAHSHFYPIRQIQQTNIIFQSSQ